MPDREREIIAAADAIARLLRANPGADPEILARECVMVLYDPPHGWRKSIYEAPGWAHGSASPEMVRASVDTIKEACAASTVRAAEREP